MQLALHSSPQNENTDGDAVGAIGGGRERGSGGGNEKGDGCWELDDASTHCT